MKILVSDGKITKALPRNNMQRQHYMKRYYY